MGKLNLLKNFVNINHCMKSVRIRSYSGPHFPVFGLNMETVEYLPVLSPNAGKYGPHIFHRAYMIRRVTEPLTILLQFKSTLIRKL